MKSMTRLFLLLLFPVFLCQETNARVSKDQVMACDSSAQTLTNASPEKPEMDRVSGQASVNLAVGKTIQSSSPAKDNHSYASGIPIQENKPFRSQTCFIVKIYLALIYPTHNFW